MMEDRSPINTEQSGPDPAPLTSEEKRQLAVLEAALIKSQEASLDQEQIEARIRFLYGTKRHTSARKETIRLPKLSKPIRILLWLLAAILVLAILLLFPFGWTDGG